MYDPLFIPITLGRLELANRVFMPAMHLNFCRDYEVNDRICAFYRERAAGGAALISVGYATVDELAGNPSNIGAHDDRFVPGLGRLAAAIHEGGAKAAVQLNHAGRYNASFLLGGRQPVAPSAVPSRLTGETPRALLPEEIESIIDRFADAAVRVREAGFDMVEVLAGTGYLISSFLSPLTNLRTDAYGGDESRRQRFGIEVISRIRARLGDDFPILVRINGHDFMEGGIGAAAMENFAAELVDAGADALCINVGWHEARIPQIVTKVPRGGFAYLARAIRAKVQVPVIASHRINDPGTARRLLGAGFCDMVALGRALIADPEFVAKARQGREQEIIHCVACGQGCFDNLLQGRPVECLCNPAAGHEQTRTARLARQPKTVLVAGGGPAGIMAAIAAAENGHRVHLYERSGRLGGQLHLAGRPPGREEFSLLADDLSRLVHRSPVLVHLHAQVNRTLLEQQPPDHLILATGGQPVRPAIPGVELQHVVTAWDILSGSVIAGCRVLVIGGGAIGIETALLLAEEATLSGEELKFLLIHGAESTEALHRLATRGGRRITVVEMTDKLGANFGKTTRWSMLDDLTRFGVETRSNTSVRSITQDMVELEVNGDIQALPVDTVILATGTAPYNPLQADAQALAIPWTAVGDAATPGTAYTATHQGYLAGRRLQ